MAKIIISNHDPLWPQLFEEEKKNLAAVLPLHVIIEHIGSTSVPGLAAKPVIDIMIGVPSLEIADQLCIKPIKNLGYIYVPEYEEHAPERRYFKKLNQDNVHTHHIHLVEYDSPWWKRILHFRDYLRSHPEVAKEYAELKKSLSAKFIDTNEYANAKTEFVKNIDD